METPRLMIKVLCPKSVAPELREAALSGAKEFERYGVKAELCEPTFRNVLDVHAGHFIRGIARSRFKQTIYAASDFRPDLWEYMFTLGRKNTVGVGITTAPLAHVNKEGEYTKDIMGASAARTGAVISVSDVMLIDAKLRESAIRIATKHELGHVFRNRGEKEHCDGQKCIMQGNDYLTNFIEKFVKPSLDFCEECKGEIARSIATLRAIANIG